MIKLKNKEINTLLNVISDSKPFMSKGFFKITEGMINEALQYTDDYGEGNDFLKKFIGYKVKIKQDGDHKNDGQLVEYTFIFKNSKNEVTEICTDMCLMLGWNYHEEVKIL